MASETDVRGYLGSKTQVLIDRYGPGPAIHYHFGLFDSEAGTYGSLAEIRRRIVDSQERMLAFAAEVWDSSSIFTGKLLDIGCGLGGGSIYWALHYDVEVTAVTNVAEHAAVVHDFADQAGVGTRIRPIVADFCTSQLDGPFEAAVAVESASQMPKDAFFRSAGQALPVGGYLCIEDGVDTTAAWKEPAGSSWVAPIENYWKANLSTLTGYVEAAEAAGFRLDRNEDVTENILEFWIQNMAWAEAKLAQPDLPAEEQHKMLQSIRWHMWMFRAYRDRGLEQRVVRFKKVRN